MKTLLLPLLLCLCSFSTGDWVKVKIDKRVTLSFPEQPKLIKGENPGWSAEMPGYKCMIEIYDFSENDSANFAAILDDPEALPYFKKKFIYDGEPVKELFEKQTTIGGKKTFEYGIQIANGYYAFKNLYNRTIFAGTTAYSLSFYEMREPKDEERERFFNSFQLDK